MADQNMETPDLILTADNGREHGMRAAEEEAAIGRGFLHEAFGIHDPTVSRSHCRIRWRGRNFWVCDGAADGAGSLLGTYLDGARLPAGHWTPLPPKATLTVGGTTLGLAYENHYTTEYDLMISYSRKDERAVLEIHDRMLALGLRPWIDQKGNRPATHYKQDIEKIMLEVRAVAVFWGGDRMGDTQAAEVEIVTDLHIHKRIPDLFLVVLPGSQDPGWGMFLNNIDYYDLRKAGETERLTSDLRKTLLGDRAG